MRKKLSILMIDDDVEFSGLARIILSQKGGYEVEVCNRSGQALDIIRAWKPDLILLDLVMPDLDGTEIAAILRKDPELCAIPVIFLTSLMTPREAAAHPVIGNHDFIPKPITAENLLKQVQGFFERET